MATQVICEHHRSGNCEHSRQALDGSSAQEAVNVFPSDIEEDDPSQPLLDPWMRRQKVHYLLITALCILLLGGLIVGIWLITSNSSHTNGPLDSPFQLVNRTAWGALPNRSDIQPLPILPASRVVIIHTETHPCLNPNTCCKEVRNIQDYHINKRNYSDIAYNFLVGGDGRTYEGRGWNTIGAYSKLMNSKALGIAFIGDFEYYSPSPLQLAQAQSLLKESVKRKKLAEDYKLVAHCQVSSVISPGRMLYDIIRTWPHWEECDMKTC